MIGKKITIVVKYDKLLIDAAVSDIYPFLRLKLGEVPARRRVAPDMFETADKAHSIVQATDTNREPDHAA